MALFEGEDLACRRGEALVLEGVSFALDPGDALWLEGPNGSGKSSLLRLMAGLLRPESGVLRWDGAAIAVDREAHRARLRHLGHLDAVKAQLSVTENLSFWAEYWGIAGDVVAPALARLGIGHLAGSPGRQLSAGQRRRLGLARLALGSAALWLLDEPAAALDTDGTALLAALISDCRARGGIVVYSSHETLPVERPHRLRLAPFTS
ncbi:MAG TPA: heme ABC exporter ATP-binding protein CcmA [Candidatus Cybelea sp.]|nr:heme ABC exporter ATP-binding protein CcmA [Candidatus Cybelea sp.]